MRIRYTLRTFFIAMSAIAVMVWLGTIGWSHYRSSRASKYLESQGILRGYWEERDDWAVEVCDATTADWQQLCHLGKLWEIAVWEPVSKRPEFRTLVQRNQSSLRTLIFRYCSLSPEIALAIGDAGRVNCLNFSGATNGLKRFAVAPLPDLKEVRFLSGDVSDENLAWIAHQPAVTEVSIVYNKAITDATARTLTSCKSLRTLNLSGTSVSADGMRMLMDQLTLRELSFPAVQLDEADLTAMVDSELERIDLKHVDLTASIAPLFQCERIVFLEISLSQYEMLMISDPEITRQKKLRLWVYGLESYDDIPANPWGEVVELSRHSLTGTSLGPVSLIPGIGEPGM